MGAPTDPWPVSPEPEFDQMLRAFGHIHKSRSALKRRWRLNKICGYFGLPRAEFRKLYEIWVSENQVPFGQGDRNPK